MPKKLNRKSVLSTKRPVKVLQFGEGNFLRAFADWVIDILNEQTSFNGSIRIVQPLPTGMGETLNEQEGLYHVILNGIQNNAIVKETRLITSVDGVVNPFADFSGYLKEAENPDLKFVISNTTEAGIAFSQSDTDPQALAATFPGKLTTLLYHRFNFFQGSPDSGLVFLPCELIEKNGRQLKETILRYSEHWQLPDKFIEWINAHNIFCDTLVDRIVPGFPADTIEEIKIETGFDDNLVVKAEPFHLWVIEGPEIVARLFPTSETSLNVKFVNDLTPYRTRKVRILNGAHTAMVPVSYLKGLRTVQEAVEDPAVGEYVRQLIDQEIIPTLNLPEEELNTFAASVLERFRNPFIRHELISIALNAISKFKVRVLPSLLEYQKRKQAVPPLLTKAFASLILFYRGESDGAPIPLNDSADVLDFFSKTWQLPSLPAVVQAVLENETFWGEDLTHQEGLKDSVIAQLINLTVNQKTQAII